MKKKNLGSFGGRKNEVEEPIENITWGGDESCKMKPTRRLPGGRWRLQDETNKDDYLGGRWRLQNETNKDGSNLTAEITESVRVCWMGMNGRAVEDEYENTNR